LALFFLKGELFGAGISSSGNKARARFRFGVPTPFPAANSAMESLA